jgi:hypothetical protein
MQKILKFPLFLKVLLGIAASVLIFSLGVYAYKNYINPPSLGEGFTYIGSEETGCYFFVPLCSQGIGERFYFATDMRPEEIQLYFHDTYNIRREHVSQSAVPDGFSNEELGFQFTLNNQTRGFTLEMYDNPSYVREKLRLFQSGKKYIVGITDDGYKLAKENLKNY